MKLAARVSTLATSATLALKRQVDDLRRRGASVIDLGLGEPDLDTPAHVKDAGKAAIDANFTRYTAESGIAELREAVAERYARDFGLDCRADEIVITAGAKQALFNIAMALFDPGDEVVLLSPYWVSYPEQIKLTGARPVVVETSAQDGFRVQAQVVAEHVAPKTKALIVNSPCNPTGAVIAPDELQKLVALAERKGFYLISDECYEHFLYEGTHACAAQFGREHVIVVSAASKSYAMTGWRVGWSLAPRVLTQSLAKVQSQTTSHPASIAQKAALAALRGPQGARQEMIAIYRQRRQLLLQELQTMDKVRCCAPAGAFYVFPHVSSDSGFAQRLLESAGVAVVPGEAFGRPGHVRISYAAPEGDLREGMKRLRGFLASRA